MWSEGERTVVVGDGMRRRRSEGNEPSLITKSIANTNNTNEGVNLDIERLMPVKRRRRGNFTRQVNGNLRTNILHFLIYIYYFFR